MGASAGPDIVDTGLVLALDAADRNSYPGSGTTWTDLSGNGNNGTLTNGPTFSSVNGGSLVFDGTNDLVNCGSSASLNLTSNLTLNAWIYPTSFGGNNFGRILQKDSVGGNGYVFFLDNTGSTGTNGIRYVAVDQAGSGTINNIVSLNTWANFAVTHFGTSATVYKNGVSVGTITGLPGSINSGAEIFYIGDRAEGGRAFSGTMSFISAYNRALTAAEIQQNFNATRSRFGI